jgi:hypothetical protein
MIDIHHVTILSPLIYTTFHGDWEIGCEGKR